MDVPKTRGRGRPKSAATLERERLETLFAKKPSHLPVAESDLTRALREAQPYNDAIEKQILRDYKYDATVPDDHAFTMASLGDESLYGHETMIIAQDEAHRARVSRQRANGAAATRASSMRRARLIINKNLILITYLLKVRRQSVSLVARKIQTEWDVITVAQRISGEPNTLTARGDGNPMPSQRTIREWLRKYYLRTTPMLEETR